MVGAHYRKAVSRPRASRMRLLHSRGRDSLDEVTLADEEDDEDRDERDDGHREQ